MYSNNFLLRVFPIPATLSNALTPYSLIHFNNSEKDGYTFAISSAIFTETPGNCDNCII